MNHKMNSNIANHYRVRFSLICLKKPLKKLDRVERDYLWWFLRQYIPYLRAMYAIFPNRRKKGFYDEEKALIENWFRWRIKAETVKEKFKTAQSKPYCDGSPGVTFVSKFLPITGEKKTSDLAVGGRESFLPNDDLWMFKIFSRRDWVSLSWWTGASYEKAITLPKNEPEWVEIERYIAKMPPQMAPLEPELRAIIAAMKGGRTPDFQEFDKKLLENFNNYPALDVAERHFAASLNSNTINLALIKRYRGAWLKDKFFVPDWDLEYS